MGVIGRARIKTVIADALLWAILFGTAGDPAWAQGWMYIAILWASTIVPLYGPFRFDEGLIEERMSKKPDAKRWDRIFIALVGILTLAELIVPGLDHRYRWTSPLPLWVISVGFVVVLAGTAGLVWSMRVNRFFSAVIRIQRDRGHSVITSGPYRFVRHPGYATWSVRTLGVPMLLGSLWGFIPAVLFVSSFVVRTALEDGVLQEELPGYREYAKNVRARLVPGVW